MKKNSCKFNLSVGMKQMVFCAPSVVDEFYVEKTVCAKNPNVEVEVHCNPLVVLLNQKRLDKLGAMGLDEWLSQFDLKKTSEMDKLRSQCSDDDLIATMKSRHLQSPAEILAWSRYMSENLDTFSKEVKAAIQQEQSVQKEATTDVNVESKTE